MKISSGIKIIVRFQKVCKPEKKNKVYVCAHRMSMELNKPVLHALPGETEICF